MAELVVQDDPDAEITFQPVDASGDTFINTGHEIVIVVGPGTGWAFTIQNGQPCSFGTLPTHHDPLTYNVPAPGVQGQSERLNPRRFNDDSGRAQITYTNPVGLQVAVTKANLTFKDTA